MKKQAPAARPEDGNPPLQERALTWLTTNSLTATAISGGAIYLLTVEEYREAYRPYGVSPAEVGVDYTTAVWPAAQALLFIALIAYVLTDLLPTRLLAYVNIPIRFDNPTEKDFQSLVEVLSRFSDRKVLVHCQVNMRASSLVFLHRVIVGKEPPEQAYEAVTRVWSPQGPWRALLVTLLRKHQIAFEPY